MPIEDQERDMLRPRCTLRSAVSVETQIDLPSVDDQTRPKTVHHQDGHTSSEGIPKTEEQGSIDSRADMSIFSNIHSTSSGSPVSMSTPERRLAPRSSSIDACVLLPNTDILTGSICLTRYSVDDLGFRDSRHSYQLYHPSLHIMAHPSIRRSDQNLPRISRYRDDALFHHQAGTSESYQETGAGHTTRH